MPPLPLSNALTLCGAKPTTNWGQTPINVVLDTNILLDLALFADPRCSELWADLKQGRLRWLSTVEMREEFRRVLDYEHLARIRNRRGVTVTSLLDWFDHHAQICTVAPRAPYVCKDPDDQKFIDLAVAHQATLYSKDKYVLALKNRLARLGIVVVSLN